MDVQTLLSSAATKYGLDPDFVTSIAKAESNFNPNAVSPKGATGVMQLMPETAKGLGVDPRDPSQNIDGGVRYLAKLADQFNGDPVKIAAAYNAGPGRVQKFGGVPPYKETQGYVQKVMGDYRPTGVAATTESNGHSAAFNHWVQSIGGTPAAAPGQAPKPPPPPAPEDVPPPPLKDFDVDASGKPVAPLSPGAQTAKQAALAQAKGTVTKPIPFLGDRTLDVGGMAQQVVNPFTFSTLPVLHAGLNAAQQGISNFLAPIAPALGGQAHDIYGKPLAPGQKPISMAEQFQGTLAADQERQAAFEKMHPRAALAGNLLGFVSPEGAFGAVSNAIEKPLVAGATRVAPRFAKNAKGELTTLARVVPASLAMGATGAAQSALEGVQQGETPGQIGQRALASGVTTAAAGGVGELAARGLGGAVAPMLPRSANPLTVRAAQMAARGIGYGAGAGVTGGVASTLNGGNFGQGFSDGFIPAALLGAAHEGMRPTESLTKTPDARDRARALDDLAAAGVTPQNMASAHPDATVADIVPNAVELVRRAANHGGNVHSTLESALGQRQDPFDVENRVASDLGAAGVDPHTAEQDFQARQSALEASNRSAAAREAKQKAETTPSKVQERLASAYTNATGIDPAKASAKAEADGEMRQTNEVAPAYEPVMTNEGVYSPDIEHLTTIDKDWAEALSRARAQVVYAGHLPYVDNPAFGKQGHLAAEGSHPEVQHGTLEVVPKDMEHLGAQVPPEIRQIAEDIKAGKAFRPKGKTLVGFLRSLGGIKNEGGEITRLFGGKKGAPLAAAGKGVGMDEAARSAKEAGYDVGDPRETDAGPQDLIDALERHVRKGPLHPRTAENNALAERRAQIERAIDQLNELGIDHTQMSVDEIANALHNPERFASENLPPPHEGEGQPEHASPEDYYRDRERDWEDFVAGKHREPELPPEPGQPEQPRLIKQPKVIPTKALLITAKQIFDRIKRLKEPYDYAQATTRNAYINPILDAHIPGLDEARNIAGDVISNREAFREGYGLHERSARADQASRVAEEFASKTEGDQQKMREGYLAREHRMMEDAQVRPGDHAENPFHQQVRRILFGEGAATAMEDALKEEQQRRDAKPGQGAADVLHRKAHDEGRKSVQTTPDPRAFAKEWALMTTEQKQAYREGLIAEISRRLEGTQQKGLFSKALTPGFVEHLRTVLGDRAAQAVVDAAQREKNFSKNASDILSASKAGRPKQDNAIQGARRLFETIFNVGPMTPGHANALGDIMAAKANDLASELAQRQALRGVQQKRQENIQSALSPFVRGAAGLAGTKVAGMAQGNQ
jgi:Transglycosylase SLT domain